MAIEMKEALQIALDNEQKGKAIYSETAEKTSHPFVKKAFTYLADQEEFHIKEIKKFMAEEHPGMELGGDTLEDTKRFFTMTVDEFKKKTELAKSDIDGYNAGIHLEKESYKFYKDLNEKAADEPTRRFFAFLMQQEAAHHVFLEKSFEFIRDPAGFHSETEDWMFEG